MRQTYGKGCRKFHAKKLPNKETKAAPGFAPLRSLRETRRRLCDKLRESLSKIACRKLPEKEAKAASKLCSFAVFG